MKFFLFVSAISIAMTQANQRKIIDSGRLQADTLVKEAPDNTTVRVDTMSEEIDVIKYDKYSVSTDMSDLPTLHPLIVHFAISLIIVGAFLQLLNVFLFKKDLAWVVFLLISAGFITAIISDNNFQPQTLGLARRAAIVVNMHEIWAQWTIRTAFLALILQIIHLFITRFDKVIMSPSGNTKPTDFKRSRLVMTLIAVILLTSAFSVIRAGHLGSQLVHIEGTGPQGRFLR